MEFKKATRNLEFDDFINAAEEIKEAKQEAESKNEEVKIIVQLPTSLYDDISKRVKKHNHTLSLKNFVMKFGIEDNKYLNDEAIIKAYEDSALECVAVGDYIKQKLGFIKLSSPYEYKKEWIKSSSITINRKERDELMKKVAKYKLTQKAYLAMKLKIGLETLTLFNHDEIDTIIEESSKANLSPKEYISNKILK